MCTIGPSHPSSSTNPSPLSELDCPLQGTHNRHQSDGPKPNPHELLWSDLQEAWSPLNESTWGNQIRRSPTICIHYAWTASALKYPRVIEAKQTPNTLVGKVSPSPQLAIAGTSKRTLISLSVPNQATANSRGEKKVKTQDISENVIVTDPISSPAFCVSLVLYFGNAFLSFSLSHANYLSLFHWNHIVIWSFTEIIQEKCRQKY